MPIIVQPREAIAIAPTSETPLERRVAQLLGRDHVVSREGLKAGEEIKRVTVADICRTGHFELRQNCHSDVYVKFPEDFLGSKEGSALVELFITFLYATAFITRDPEVIAGPARTGSQIARLMSEHLTKARGKEISWVEIEKNPRSESGYQLSAKAANAVAGKRVLAVDDIINTGLVLGAVVVPELRSAGALVMGAAVLVDRNYRRMAFPCRLASPFKLEQANYYPATDCPMCQAGQDIDRF